VQSFSGNRVLINHPKDKVGDAKACILYLDAHFAYPVQPVLKLPYRVSQCNCLSSLKLEPLMLCRHRIQRTSLSNPKTDRH
jgi:hypothetical protein